MKKHILALGLALLLLCGCGKTEAVEKQPEVVKETGEASAVEEQSMEPIGLYDDGTYALSVVDFRQDAAWGAVLTVELQNGSGREVACLLRGVVVNGVMCDPGWSCAAAAGETVRSELWWTAPALERQGVGAVQALDAEVVLLEGGTELRAERITARLPGEGAARVAVPASGFSPVLLAEGEGFSATATDFDEESQTLTIHLVNSTGGELMFAAEQVTVGGAEWDPGWAMVVLPRTETYARMTWDGEGYFGEIAFLLRVYDQQETDAEDLFAGIVTVDEE